MGIGERIQKLGFKRWYERTLIESHAYLVTSLLGLILALAGIELIGARSGAMGFLLGFGAGAIGIPLVVFGLNRYYRTLMLASSFGSRATCCRCETYARFSVTAAGPRPGETAPAPDTTWVRVKCRECGNEWTM